MAVGSGGIARNQGLLCAGECSATENINLFLLALGFCLHFKSMEVEGGVRGRIEFEQDTSFMWHAEFVVMVSTNIYK